MATRVISNTQRTWEGERDDQGYRTWPVTFLVESALGDGPAAVMTTPGLPLVGSLYIIGTDFDLWAWCTPYMKIKAMSGTKEGSKVRVWSVDMKFTTKPLDRDRSTSPGREDPTQEPDKVSGSFVKYTEEALKDRFGMPILTSSFEQIRGPQNEWDANRPKVKVEQQVPELQADLWGPMIDCVNDASLWGFAARCWKLSDISWEKKFHGNFDYYYVRTFEFDGRADTFDRDLLDEGTKALHGEWSATTGAYVITAFDVFGLIMPDYLNPQHYIRFKDKNGENARCILNGFGRPISGDSGTGTLDAAGRRHVSKYNEANFLLLGIPLTL